ncbi:MAG: hypothetical protein JW947_01785 [Sedimentisphaerales bacterium]|nr:hypothetical protein [Sedimentisphaerales bacterium]
MKKYLKVVLFGFLTWLVPFTVSFLIFPLKSSNRAFFESIMAVVVAISAVLFTVLYLKKLSSGFLREGILAGIIWFVINIVIDLMLFMEGPMKMSFADYIMDIGFTYLIIPAVTIGFGFLLQRKIT